jgi:hypothetical protein
MPTYISMLNWSGSPQPLPSDLRASVVCQEARLRANGLHSLALLPDEGACAAVMVSSVAGEYAAEELARLILPQATIRIESMRFDEHPKEQDGTREAVCPPPPRDYLNAVLEAVVGG